MYMYVCIVKPQPEGSIEKILRFAQIVNENCCFNTKEQFMINKSVRMKQKDMCQGDLMSAPMLIAIYYDAYEITVDN